MEWLQCISVFLLLVCLVEADREIYCKAPESKPSKVAKPTIASQFNVHVEMIDVVKRTTTEITEYYDGPGNRAAVFISENAGKSKRYYRYNEQLYLDVSEDIGLCIPTPISEGDHRMGFIQKNGTRRILSPSAALFFNVPGQVENYMGQEVIRGIITDHWYSCITSQDPKSNLAFDWYFSTADEWNTAGQIAQVPVRCTIKGYDYELPQNASVIEQYWEFYHYRTGPPKDLTVFDTSRGLLCNLKNDTKMPPTIPEIMSFRLEHIDTQLGSVTYSDEVYDFVSRITKHVYRTPPPALFHYNHHPLTVINDFNTGVSYNIDMIMGNCTTRSIGQLFTDVKQVDSRHVRMTSPKEFFNLDNHFYQGVRTTRDIKSDVWIGKEDGKLKNSKIEWFFALPEVVGQTKTTGGTLVHYAEYRKDELLPAYLSNLYDFTQDAPDILQFDVSRCYTHTHSEHFEIYFDKKHTGHISAGLNKFKIDLVMSVALAASVSPLRVQNIDVSKMVDGGMMVAFELLDAAPKIGDVQLPIKEKTLATASSKLHNMLKTGTLEIYVQSFNKMITVNPTELLFKKLPTRYGGGAMFGLAVLMMVIGMFLVGVIMLKKETLSI